ncbi:phage major capsid protein [Streptomyces sp. 796.1]|uniref:phage major capsid protein n=1 Tax=Streptomyces sp. 796.1 TaxID=3163029 RepID=UPI0039C97623
MSEFPALKDALGKLDAARKSLRDVFAEAGPDYDMSKVKSLTGDSTEKLGWVRTKNEEITELKGEVERLKEINKAVDELALDDAHRETGADAGPESKGGARSLVGQFLKSDAYRNVGRKATLDVEVKTLFQRTAGWDPEDVRSGRVELTPLRPETHVVDFIPKGTISQSDYKYMEETTHTATAVVEVAEGATFGEAALALTERSRSVEKLPAWIPVTDEQLEDEPAARAYLEARLTGMVRRRLDSQVLVGNGTTPNLLGTENVVGIQSQALGADTTLDAIYKLFTSIRSDGFAEPNVLFIAPSKWQAVQLLKTADGQYIWGHPASSGPTTVWGVPVVPTTAHTATKAIAGDFAQYSMLFIRRGIDVQVTNSHSDYFINGKQVIRADMRAVMVHFRPKAFGVVTGL